MYEFALSRGSSPLPAYHAKERLPRRPQRDKQDRKGKLRQKRTKEDKTRQEMRLYLSLFVLCRYTSLGLKWLRPTNQKPMLPLSRITASFKTYVRGIALPGEEPLFIVTPLMVVAATALILVFDLAATQLIWSSQRAWLYPLLVPLLALGQSAFWYLYMEQHHAVHGAISKRKWVNVVVAEITSILSLAQAPSVYTPKHLLEHHNPQHLANSGDPDFHWLQSLGFLPGQTIEQYWWLLWRLLFNPAFYLKNLATRVRGHIKQAPITHRVTLLIWWASLIAAAEAFQLWPALLMYLSLLTVAAPISSLLQTLTEHVWASKENPEMKTHPRLLPIDSNPRLFLVFLYWRMAILSTDLAQHQAHHYKPINRNWPMAAYSDYARSDLPRAVWGIRNHFRISLDSLSKAPHSHK